MRRFLLLCLAGAGLSTVDATPWQGFTALVLSPDGTTFATGGREGEILQWETATGELLSRWVKPGAGPVVALSFDSKARLGAAFLDGSMGLAIPDAEVLAPVAAAEPIRWVLSGARAKWLASGPLTTPIRVTSATLWAVGTPEGKITVGNRSDGRILAAWAAHDAAVTGLALADDGSFLLSCSYDGTLCQWDPMTGQSRGTLPSPRF